MMLFFLKWDVISQFSFTAQRQFGTAGLHCMNQHQHCVGVEGKVNRKTIIMLSKVQSVPLLLTRIVTVFAGGIGVFKHQEACRIAVPGLVLSQAMYTCAEIT